MTNRWSFLCFFALAACSGASSRAGDAADADAGTRLEPVHVFRGDPAKQFYDLTLLGQNLAQFEGIVTTVRVGSPDRPPERLASGQTRVVAGTFSMLLPLAFEGSLYKRKLVHFDVDADARCTATDQVWDDSSFTDTTVTLVVEPGFQLQAATDATCQVINNWPTE